MWWKTIETAPKNRSIILNINGKVIVGHFKLEWMAWKAEFSHDDMGALPHPTHWMELPLTPEEAE